MNIYQSDKNGHELPTSPPPPHNKLLRTVYYVNDIQNTYNYNQNHLVYRINPTISYTVVLHT